MLALSIRQPFAELILRGVKTVEYRTRPTRIVGERFYIYASKGTQASIRQAQDRLRHGGGSRLAGGHKGVWSYDLSGIADPPEWMIELAEQIKLLPQGIELPRGAKLIGP